MVLLLELEMLELGILEQKHFYLDPFVVVDIHLEDMMQNFVAHMDPLEDRHHQEVGMHLVVVEGKHHLVEDRHLVVVEDKHHLVVDRHLVVVVGKRLVVNIRYFTIIFVDL